MSEHHAPPVPSSYGDNPREALAFDFQFLTDEEIRFLGRAVIISFHQTLAEEERVAAFRGATRDEVRGIYSSIDSKFRESFSGLSSIDPFRTESLWMKWVGSRSLLDVNLAAGLTEEAYELKPDQVQVALDALGGRARSSGDAGYGDDLNGKLNLQDSVEYAQSLIYERQLLQRERNTTGD